MSNEKTGSTQHHDPQPEVRYVPVEYRPEQYNTDDEISLIDLIRTMWEGRRTILITTGIFFSIGIFVFLFGQREYESTAVLIQEQRQLPAGGNQLFQQFGLGGGNLNQNVYTIPPSLYPDIINSADFLLDIASHEVSFESLQNTLTPLVYFNEYYTPPLTQRTSDLLKNYTIRLPVTLYRGIRNFFRSDTEVLAADPLLQRDERFLSLTREERIALREIRDRIEIVMNGSLITFLVRMPDAKAAAELNHYVIEQIQDYVIDYRISKYRQTLEFVEAQFEDSRTRYEEAQMELARFSDRNRSITTNVARTEQQALQNRRVVTFNVYNTMAQEVEQARIRLQEETPVFNVLQKPQLPHAQQSRSILILILTVFLGGVFGVVMVFLSQASTVVREHLAGSA